MKISYSSPPAAGQKPALFIGNALVVPVVSLTVKYNDLVVLRIVFKIGQCIHPQARPWVWMHSEQAAFGPIQR